MKKPVACIYKNEAGEIYQIRVVTSRDVITIPVSNSSEKTCRQTIKQMFGRCEILIAQLLPDDETGEADNHVYKAGD